MLKHVHFHWLKHFDLSFLISTIVLYGYGLIFSIFMHFLNRMEGGFFFFFCRVLHFLISFFFSLPHFQQVPSFSIQLSLPKKQYFSKMPLSFLYTSKLLSCSQCYELPSFDRHSVFCIELFLSGVTVLSSVPHCFFFFFF